MLPFRICCKCGIVTSKNNMRITQYGQYCENCYTTLRICRCCNRFFHDSPTDHIDTVYHFEDLGNICRECYWRNFRLCSHCHKAYISSELRIVHGKAFCFDCFNKHYFQCRHCLNVLKLSEESERLRVCNSCIEHYIQCEHCEEYIHEEFATFHDEEPYCQSCYDELFNIQYWRTTEFSPNKKYDIIPSIQFGIELETSTYEYDPCLRESCFGCKDDGSVSGKEFFSPPMTSDSALREIETFCNSAKQAGLEVNCNCGYHLHIDMDNQEWRSLQKTLLAYLYFERLWISFVPRSRRRNEYCGCIDFDSDFVIECLDIEDFIEEMPEGDKSDKRYCWFNPTAYNKHGTFEIRLHTGTLNYTKITNWIIANLRFVQWSKNVPLSEIQETARYSDQQLFNKFTEIVGRDIASYYKDRAARFGTEYKLEEYTLLELPIVQYEQDFTEELQLMGA